MTLTQDTLAAINARETGSAFFILVAFSQADWVARVVKNNEPISHGGHVYSPALISITMPDIRGGTPTSPGFEVSNVDPIIIAGFRLVTGGVDVTMTMVRHDDPETAIQGPYTLRLTSITYDTSAIRGTLIMEPLEQKPLSHMTFSPAYFPGLFG